MGRACLARTRLIGQKGVRRPGGPVHFVPMRPASLLLVAATLVAGLTIDLSLAAAQCLGGTPDGMVAPSEACDDNNGTAGDGCSATCAIEGEFSCGKAVSYADLAVQDFTGAGAAWTVVSNNTGIQTTNTQKPTIALFGQNAQLGTYITEMAVQTTNDDDVIGFALGFDPGDQNSATADWIVIDWKQLTQQGVPPGLRVGHVLGAPNGGDSIDHDIVQRRNPATAGPAGSLTRQLTTGRRFGTTGWADNTIYNARIEYRPGRLRLWIDGQLELDLEPGDFPGEFAGNVFPNGQIGFYLLSQDQVRYTNLVPFGPSVCNLTSLGNTTVTVATGTANVPVAVAPLFMDVGDALNQASIAVTGVTGAATATVVGGNVVVTPTNPNVPGTYTVNYLACDNDAVIPDCDDAVITVVYSPNTDGDGALDAVDLDDDNDGIPDTAENTAGLNPSGDADGDGVPNYLDRNNRGDGMAQTCTDASNDQVCDVPGLLYDRDGDGVANHLDLDSDNDGLFDTVEGAAGIPDAATRNGVIDCPGGFGSNGLCDSVETAADSGVVDYDDNGAGPDATRNTDGDSLPDFLDIDSDGDGLWDVAEGESGCVDTTPRNGRCDGTDPDGDGIVGAIDNVNGRGATNVPAPPDTDGDGTPDVRELDSDNDTINDLIEGNAGCVDTAAPAGRCDGPDADGDGDADDANATIPNTDGDAQPDYQDVDADGDGLRDNVEGTRDTDGDTRPDFRDLDSDNDGIADVIEGQTGCADTTPRNGRCDGADANGDGLADAATDQTPPDTDGDGAVDYRDLDSDNDGGSDVLEGGSGCTDTTPADAVCDGPDTNGDGLVNSATLVAAPNSDADPTPDYLDLDSDQDGLFDVAELGSGCADSNNNAVCDGPDTDGDGIVDSIDGAPTFGDPTQTPPRNTDNNGVPDYRDLDSDNNGQPDTTTSGCVDTTPADQRCDGADGDRDGIVDPLDGFNGHGNLADADGDGVGDNVDLDDDNDGIADTAENTLGFAPDGDADGDGVPNFLDRNNRGDGMAQTCTDGNNDQRCDSPGLLYDRDGDGVANHLDLDADNDGLYDTWEGNAGIPDAAPRNAVIDCPGGFGSNGLCDAIETMADSGVVDYDDDGAGPDATRNTDDDTLPDFLDVDSDGDGLWDVAEGESGCTDAAPRDGRCDGTDADRDGIVNGIDNVAGRGTTSAPTPPDTDGDGTPDVRELDSDGDTLTDLVEGNAGCVDAAAPVGRCDGPDADGDGDADDANATIPNTDGDAQPDYQDLDADGDGLRDQVEGTADTDGDSRPDFRDLDSDNDGIPDVTEGQSGCADTTPRNGRCDGPDANGDGVADSATNLTPPDTDGDGAVDFRDLDSDNDGGPDTVEGGSGCTDTSPADAVCDGPDSNGDGLVNSAALGEPRNSDGDPTPDYLDLDSDQDGLLDLEELASGCADANQNGVCDGPDADMDGIADSIDGAPTFGDPTPTVPPNTDNTDTPDYRDPDRDNDGTPDTGESGCDDVSPADQRCDGPDTDGDGAVDPIDGFDGHGVGGDTDGDGVSDEADLDDDNDGLTDVVEGDGVTDTDGDGTPDSRDLDSDDDGLPDVVEAGHDQADGNGNGTLDCAGGFGSNGLCDEVETAPDSGSPGFTPRDTDGDGVGDWRDLDADDDGISDRAENGTTCTDDPANGVCDGADGDGDGVRGSLDMTVGFGVGGYPAAPDTDGDGAPDYRDLDSDGDGIFDLDEAGLGDLDPDDDGKVNGDDEDGDGIRDPADDSDLDGTPDSADDDPGSFGGGGRGLDTDMDGTPDQRDLDADDDGKPDEDEAGADPTNPVDTDMDGTPDFQDPDSDDDGVRDNVDVCRLLADPMQSDLDGDGLGDACDDDADGDGFPDDLGVSGGGCATTGGAGGAGGLLVLAALGAAVLGRRRRRTTAVLGAAVTGAGAAVLLAGPAPAAAQGLTTSYPVERMRLTGDRDGVLDAEWGDVGGHLDLDLGLWVGYSDDPLNLYTQMDGADRERVGSLVARRLGADVVAAFDLWKRVQLGLSVPLILSQSDDLGALMATPPELSGFGLGDVRLTPKLALLKQGRSPLSAAVLVGVSLPTASTEDYGGETRTVLAPELALSRAFASGFKLVGNVGYTWRDTTTALDLVVDDEVHARVGAGYWFGAGGGAPVELDATFALATAAEDLLGAFNRNYAEAKLGVNWDPTRQLRLFAIGGVGVAEGFGTPDWRALAGLRLDPMPRDKAAPVVADNDRDGDGILDGADQCPTEPEDLDSFEDVNGCPDPDNDADTILDVADKCPLEPEDVDSFEDDNGCPDPDNDADGVPDVSDKCPLQAGPEENGGCPDPDRDGDGVVDRVDACPDQAGPAARQGCPDRDGDTVIDTADNCPDEPGPPENQGCAKEQLVKITGGKLEILDVVYFKLNKAVIEKRSYALLDNVASVLGAHEEIKKVRVEGHTDSQGSDASNKKLSQNRANAVRKYLVDAGVDASRLDAMGFGEEKPLQDNRTKEGRAANRRVEFVITEGGSDAVKTERTGPGGDTLED